jgi:hypothetical protein
MISAPTVIKKRVGISQPRFFLSVSQLSTKTACMFQYLPYPAVNRDNLETYF